MERNFDVIVAGGGPAGVSAAIAAARNGSNTLLIEREGYLGGMATASGVPAFGPFTNGERDLIGGIGREILERLKARAYQSPFYDRKPDRIEGLDWVPIDGELLKQVLDEMVLESGCKALLHTAVIAAEAGGRGPEAGVIDRIEVCHSGGREFLYGSYFIDCTGNGELACMAGAGWNYGDERGRVQAGTLCFQVAGVDMERFMDYAEETGEDGNLSIASQRARAAGGFPAQEIKVGGLAFPAKGVAALNFGHVYDINLLDPWSLSCKEMEARRKLPELVSFLRNYVPGMEQCVLTSSGPFLGIRESRRIKGLYTLTREDYVQRADFSDAIAYYSYPIDMHPAAPDESQEREAVYLSSKYKNGECYGIPYRCLIPKGFKNLGAAGRIISADRAVTASVRIMSACFATGQAMGTAAAIGVSKGGKMSLESVDEKELRRILRSQKSYIKE